MLLGGVPIDTDQAYVVTPEQANVTEDFITAALVRGDAVAHVVLQFQVSIAGLEQPTAGMIELADPINDLREQFLGTFESPCEDAADIDDNGERELADAVNSLSFQFLGAFAIPAPFPACGVDPTPDELGCDRARCQ